MNEVQVKELLLQALETELGGRRVYETALTCVQNDDLRGEWQEYLEQTTRHIEVVTGLLQAFDIDPRTTTPGRSVVHHIGASLVEAMEKARSAGEPEAAQLVAAECVTLAETKDHLNWELIGEVASSLSGERAKALSEAHDEVFDEESEHLFHTTGWGRELWIESLGMSAVLPPPEERRNVKTPIGAARAQHARDGMT